MNYWAYVAVAMGGALGATLRFAVSRWMQPLMASGGFPWATFAVNLAGSLLLGIIYTLGKANWLQDGYRLFWATGVMGALTTFSTFAVEGILLLEAGRWKLALLYWILSLLCGGLLAFLGMHIGSRIAGS
ncbi:MAG TPA: fluoride efflux transporter CrcB [Leptospiraceae bacterium]|nr:fluoride efflux transporter CrcB [Spirochaetaceae bacterium]HBS06625.1 fluoride efflux transporter CrcB [Leptospiraceae bacterium]|tara:strand:- start:135003 stop:135392 length:390 start_codon:yes stop_codon:yes gene_type:complete